MAESSVWTPPSKIEELYSATSGSTFAAINAPTAGARTEVPLPEGSAPFQLYSLGTPNGIKVSILLEELADLIGFEYDAHFYNIGKGDQFGSGFVSVNPNSKIPCGIDRDGPGGKPVRLFESGSIVVYLAEKFGKFIPQDPAMKAEVMNWVFWQMGGQGPMTGNYGHFFVYCPPDKCETRDYGVSRYGMEVQRLCDVLERHLRGEGGMLGSEGSGTERTYLVGEEYSIADMMCFPWFNQLRTGYIHSSGTRTSDFLSIEKYTKLNEWADRILARPAVQRGIQVCSWSAGVGKPWLVKKEEEEAK